MTFEELGVNKNLTANLTSEGIVIPTSVQAGAIPILLSGRDIIVRAKTGSGKTFAFALPIIQNLTPDRCVQALVLAPTRELALQIAEEFQRCNRAVNVVTIYGGVGISPQIDKLHGWAQVVVGTPGRVIDHLQRRTFDPTNIRMVVLDEADRMFEMGFIDDIRTIMRNMPRERQTALFSATMPDQVVRLSQEYMRTPEQLILDQDEITVKDILQTCYGVDRSQKLDALFSVLRQKDVSKAIIFCNTKRWAESLSKILEKRYKVACLHADLSQNRRTKEIDDFKEGKYDILVATDLAARGLHVDSVSHVINYDLPKNPKDYVHRIGRTGRIGNKGVAISFMTQLDQPLLKGIEQEIQQYLEVQSFQGLPPPRPMYQSDRPRERPMTERFERHGNRFEHRETRTMPVEQANTHIAEQTSSASSSSWDRWD